MNNIVSVLSRSQKIALKEKLNFDSDQPRCTNCIHKIRENKKFKCTIGQWVVTAQSICDAWESKKGEYL